MQKRRVISVVVGAVLCLGAFAVVLNNRFTKQADKETVAPTQTTLTDRAAVQGGEAPAAPAAPAIAEVTPEGNVRPTLPKPVYTAAAMRGRIQAPPPAPVVVPPPYMVETIRIDPPIPPPWQPPPSDQRPLPR